MKSGKSGFNSTLIHGGDYEDALGSVITPVFQSSTFKFKNADHGAACFAGEEEGYIYTRIGNPTIRDLEKTMAQLEHGYDGIGTSSGMGAINCVYLGYLHAGSHIVSHEALYGPARVVLETLYVKFGVESTFVNTSDLRQVERAIKPNTRLIYTETPANPTMDITDIRALSEIAHRNNIPLCVDNTFCSPYLQQPLELGADIVLHSMTKFINGHADVVAGILIPKTQESYKRLKSVMVNVGCNMDPHQAFLARRGLKTLGVRIDRAQENAIRVADFLSKHPKVDWIKYPGLPSHPQYKLAMEQMKGPGAMLSFGLKGGLKAGKIMMDSVNLALLAVSLGGIETLIQHPASMTHAKMSNEAKQHAGITDGLVRLSVGIEDIDDIIADLDQALKKA